ncbi:MAG: acyltransferase family protein [Terracidiphilus sp.]
MILSVRNGTPTSPPVAVRPPRALRLLSLDVLRGMTVALMILVNNAGDGAVSYPQLRHSVWNGCTLTDLVFPSFLFIVGASIALAFSVRLGRGASRKSILLQSAKRAVLIFLVGLLLNALPFFHLADLRVYGVLQRIALCYFLAAALYLAGGTRLCAAATGLALLGYWALLLHVPVPGFGLPAVDVPVLDRTANLASWLDRLLIPSAHLYRHGVYDPEGLLSTLPALATTLLGLLAMRWLQAAAPSRSRSLLLAAAGLVLLLLGLLWSSSFPLNKRLWTSSFVLFTGGISAILLALLHWAIDGPWQLRKGLAPWLVFGTNALSAYVLSEVLAGLLAAIPFPGASNLQQALYRLLPQWLGPPPFVSLVYSILFAAVCFLPILFLYRRKIFIKL